MLCFYSLEQLPRLAKDEEANHVFSAAHMNLFAEAFTAIDGRVTRRIPACMLEQNRHPCKATAVRLAQKIFQKALCGDFFQHSSPVKMWELRVLFGARQTLVFGSAKSDRLQ